MNPKLLPSIPVLVLLFAGRLAAGGASYFEIQMGGKPVGYMRIAPDRQKPAAGRGFKAVRVVTRVIVPDPTDRIVAHQVERTVLGPDGIPVSYQLEVTGGAEMVSLEASYRKGRAFIRAGSPKRGYLSKELPIDRGMPRDWGVPFLVELAHGTTKKRRLRVFAPRSGGPHQVVIEPQGVETIPARRGRVSCRKFLYTQADTRVSLWLDDQGKLVRMHYRKGGRQMTFLAADPDVVRHGRSEGPASPLARIRPLPWRFARDIHYDFRFGDKKVGTLRVRFEKTAEGGFAASSSLDIETSGRAVKGNARTVYGADWTPSTFRFDGDERTPRSPRRVRLAIHCRFEGPSAFEKYGRGLTRLHLTRPISPGAHVLYDYNVETIAVFCSQVNLAAGNLTTVPVYHPKIFKGFLVTVRTGEADAAGVRTCRLECPFFSATVRIDARGRMLSFARGFLTVSLREK